MAKTQRARIEELESAIDLIYKKTRYGLKAQIARDDRNSLEVANNIGDRIMAICMEVKNGREK